MKGVGIDMGKKRQRIRSESPDSRRHRRRQRRDGAPAPSSLLGVDDDKSDPRRQTEAPYQHLEPPPASGRKNPQQLRRSPRKLAGPASTSFNRDRRDSSSTVEEEEEVDELDDELDELNQEDDLEGMVIEDSEPERQAAEADREDDVASDEEHAEANGSRSTRGIKANYVDRGSDSAASTSSDESVTEFADSNSDEEGGNRSSSPSSVSTLRDGSASSLACSTQSESESDGATDESRTPRGRRRRLFPIAVSDSDSDSTASSSIVVASRTPRRSPRRPPPGRNTSSPSLSACRTPRSSLILTPRRERFFHELSPFMHEAFVRPNDPEMLAVDKAYRKQAQSDFDYAPSSDSDSAGRSRRRSPKRGRPPRGSLVLLPGAVLDDSSEDDDDGEEWFGCDSEAHDEEENLTPAEEFPDRALDADSDDGWDEWDLPDEEQMLPRGDGASDAGIRDGGDVLLAGEVIEDSEGQDEGYASQAADKPISPPAANDEPRVPIPRRGSRPSQNIVGRYEDLGWTIEGLPAPHRSVRFHGLGAASPVYDPSPPLSPPNEEEEKSFAPIRKEVEEWFDAYNKSKEEFHARMMENVPPGWGEPEPEAAVVEEPVIAEEEEEVDQLADSDELEYADPPPPPRRRHRRQSKR